MSKIRYGAIVFTMLCLMISGAGMGMTAADAAGPNPVVIFETNMGRIIVMLYPKDTPITVENFLRYVDSGFYDGTIFHRVVNMELDRELGRDKKKQQAINIVQGGGYTYPLRMKRPTWGPIVNEDRKGLQNVKGTIAMARGNDPNSASSQFFFNVLNNPGLNPMIIKKKYSEPDESVARHGYCAFGKVIRGWDVVEKIYKVKTTRMGQHMDVPEEPVYIKRAYRAK